MSDRDKRIAKAKAIEDWLEGRSTGPDIQIIRLLLLVAEQNEQLLKYVGEE